MSKRTLRVDEVLAKARSIASGEKAAQIKEAAEKKAELPRVRTPEAEALRQLAKQLREADFSAEKEAAFARFLDGDLICDSDILEEKIAMDTTVKKGGTAADTLRNFAATLRSLGPQVKKAADQEALRELRAMLALENLSRTNI